MGAPLKYPVVDSEPVDVVEAAERRVDLVQSMLSETKRAVPYIGKSRDISRLVAELKEQRRRLREAKRHDLVSA